MSNRLWASRLGLYSFAGNFLFRRYRVQPSSGAYTVCIGCSFTAGKAAGTLTIRFHLETRLWMYLGSAYIP
jgi:hypothetical protein